jgi:hypothetical protein
VSARIYTTDTQTAGHCIAISTSKQAIHVQVKDGIVRVFDAGDGKELTKNG